ncbi:unnamed protein product [Dovyalis caffra]|uniref:Uncharacterized protein n=1 Tax=Dovyalis caffra TaxID=77055 RepID=A0AAV1RKN8_9ROSI|nr:unnamed protein product [Dovyalis caffra]
MVLPLVVDARYRTSRSDKIDERLVALEQERGSIISKAIRIGSLNCPSELIPRFFQRGKGIEELQLQGSLHHVDVPITDPLYRSPQPKPWRDDVAGQYLPLLLQALGATLPYIRCSTPTLSHAITIMEPDHLANVFPSPKSRTYEPKPNRVSNLA